jgi:hypothetical protein
MFRHDLPVQLKVAQTPHIKSRKKNLDTDMLNRRLRINLHQQPLRQIGIISSISCQECGDATASAFRAHSLTY